MKENIRPSHIRSGGSSISEFHRAQIHQEMCDLVDLYGEDGPVLSYIQQMRGSGEWGSGLEALSAGYFYKRPVSIWVNSSDGAPAATLEPPGTQGEPPIGLVHCHGNHWDSYVLPVDWHQPSSGINVFRVARQSIEEIREDRAFQEEGGPDLIRDPCLDEEQRRARRDLIAARYEAKAPPSQGKRARPKVTPTRSFARGSTGASASNGRAVTAEAEAVSTTPAITAGARLESQNLSAVQNPEVGQLDRQYCTQALMRIGLSETEALQALTACGGDVESVKQLYGIEWDPATGCTIQSWFT